MQCSELQAGCTTGTQTQLAVNRDDMLVSWTSTYSLLSTTFSQFLVEISRLLQLPLNEGSPLLTLHFEKLLAEFKDKSMELNNMRESLEQSRSLEQQPMIVDDSPDQSLERESTTPELSFHSPLMKTPPSPRQYTTPLATVQSPTLQYATPLATVQSPLQSPTSQPQLQSPLPQYVSPTQQPQYSPSMTSQPQYSVQSPSVTSRPIAPIPVVQEQQDTTHQPMQCSDNPIKASQRSAFFRPTPTPLPLKSEPVSPASSTSTNSTSSTLSDTCNTIGETKTDSELFDCLQKLQHCYDKYFTPASPHLSDYKPLLPDYKPVLPDFKDFKPLLPDFTAMNSYPLLSNPLLLNADPAMIIKAMQKTNPLLSAAKPDKQKMYTPYCTESPMKCPYCDLTFHKKSHLSNHLVQLHSHSYHCCRQCKISFPDKMSLEKHQQSHPKQQFQCSGCNLSFKTGSELKRHIKTHTQERAFMCDICGSRFNLKHNLKAHMRQHTGERPFRCKICNRGFTRSNNLKRHIYGHCQDETFVKTALQSTISPQSMMLKKSSMLQNLSPMMTIPIVAPVNHGLNSTQLL